MTYDQITEEFECSNIVATLGLSLFILGLGMQKTTLRNSSNLLLQSITDIIKKVSDLSF